MGRGFNSKLLVITRGYLSTQTTSVVNQHTHLLDQHRLSSWQKIQRHRCLKIRNMSFMNITFAWTLPNIGNDGHNYVRHILHDGFGFAYVCLTLGYLKTLMVNHGQSPFSPFKWSSIGPIPHFQVHTHIYCYIFLVPLVNVYITMENHHAFNG